jgi:hypothetical protein
VRGTVGALDSALCEAKGLPDQLRIMVHVELGAVARQLDELVRLVELFVPAEGKPA